VGVWISKKPGIELSIEGSRVTLKSFAVAMFLVGCPIVAHYSLNAALEAAGPFHCGSRPPRTPRWKKLVYDTMFERLGAPSEPPDSLPKR
jgi:hypothetical protein